MQRFLWMVLHDGRSVVAGCGSATRDSLADAIAQPATMLTLTSDGEVEHIPAASIRDFVVFEGRTAIPPASAIFRLVQL
jgi:hypothetical protein